MPTLKGAASAVALLSNASLDRATAPERFVCTCRSHRATALGRDRPVIRAAFRRVALRALFPAGHQASRPGRVDVRDTFIPQLPPDSTRVEYSDGQQ